MIVFLPPPSSGSPGADGTHPAPTGQARTGPHGTADDPDYAEVAHMLTGVPDSASFPALLVALAGVGGPLELPTDPSIEVEYAAVLADATHRAEDDSADERVAGFGFSAVAPDAASTPAESEPSETLTDAIVEVADEVTAAVVEAEARAEEGVQVPFDQEVPAVQEASAGQEPVELAPGMVSRLSRDFAVRLERVADRMWNEHGLRVEIVEGFRSQSRQDQLYAQGRTAPGPVVTWTTQSLHSVGAAADLYVDGAPITPDQALLLSRVADDEGLRTLYPFDSGHIQLDRPDFRGELEAQIPRPPRDPLGGAPAEPRTGVARVAPVAPVARPARPPGGNETPMVMDVTPASGTSAQPAAPTSGAGSTGGTASTPDPLAAGMGGGGNTAADDDAPDRDRHAVRTGVESSSPAPSGSQPHALPPVGPAGPRPLIGTAMVEGVAGPQQVDPGAFEYEPPRTAVRRLHLPIEGLPGANSIDLGVRGSTVDGWLNVSDPALAAELRRSLHELRQRLGDRGLEARAIGVRVVSGTSPDGTVASPEANAGRTGGEGSQGQEAGAERQRSQRERAPRDTRHRSANSDAHDPKEEG